MQSPQYFGFLHVAGPQSLGPPDCLARGSECWTASPALPPPPMTRQCLLNWKCWIPRVPVHTDNPWGVSVHKTFPSFPKQVCEALRCPGFCTHWTSHSWWALDCGRTFSLVSPSGCFRLWFLHLLPTEQTGRACRQTSWALTTHAGPLMWQRPSVPGVPHFPRIAFPPLLRQRLACSIPQAPGM